MLRGVMYHNKKSRMAPCESKAVDKGTLISIRGKTAADVRIKDGGRPADTRLPKAIMKPQASADSGAKNHPTEATPSVANNDALKFPPNG